MKARLISLNNVMFVKEIIVAVICILSKDITVELKSTVHFLYILILFHFLEGGGSCSNSVNLIN